jgi:2-haloacid dehalogenase
MTQLDDVDVLTFDCYGTLIDWELGIQAALESVFAHHGVNTDVQGLLEAFARHESSLEAGPYLPYRDVLAATLAGICGEFGFEPSEDERAGFASSVGDWPAFPDSAEALARLTTRFRLGVITNCDDDLFALSNLKLGVTFDPVATAQQARSYKPSLEPFRLMLDRLDVPSERILHVAQSLYHDHVPAKQVGLRTVWVDRRHGAEGFGATPAATAEPDLVMPDLRSFADLALAI